ncbi:MAG TPA: MarP family serine protease [Candidatus Limnocylindrales bacterium]
MNPLDLVAIALVVIAVVLGFNSGALPQIGGLIGAVGGGALAILALPNLVGPLESVPAGIRPYVVLAGLLMAVGIGESVGSAVGRYAARSLGTGFLGAADRMAGSLTGAAQALLVVWLAGGLLALGPSPRLSEAAQTSTAVRTLNAVLPPPTEIATDLGRLLDDSGLPDVFVGFEPLPKPPVDRPTDATARQIADLAEASTVRIRAGVCGALASGSGVVVRDGYVVTNAHVVAGSRDGAVDVSTVGGERAPATVVLFDPSLDVALLWAPQLRARPLRFATADPDRGTVGAALGYPGGGSLTIVPAAVTGSYRATGRDIYGQARVDRDILELRAQIDRGDSGGPFVTGDGTIGGLVFAEARTDPEVGYALTPTSVAIRIAPAFGRTTAVATGDCLV